MLRLLFALLANLFALPLWPWRRYRQRRAAPRGGWVSLHIPGRIAEVTPPRQRRFRLQALLGPRARPKLSLQRVRELCQMMAVDTRPVGLYVSLEPLSGGFALAEGLRTALAGLRQAGKHVHVHLPKGAGLRDYYVASVATTISLPPYADLHLVGLGAKQLYFKDALQWLGVEAEVEQRHEFKSAGEMFARSGMSDAAREQSKRLLAEVERQVYGAIIAARPGVTAEQLSRGPYRADQAKELGLIDHAVHADALDGLLAHVGKPTEGKATDVKLPDLQPSDRTKPETAAETEAPPLPEVPAAYYYGWRKRRLFRPLRRQRHVGVIRVVGNIVDGDDNVPGQASSGALCDAVELACDVPSIAAVVLLVDSRGGSAFASAEMHHALTRLAKKKPLVAYFSDYAASGGYYVAAGAKAIITNPLAVTGSIGVISMRPVLNQLFDRLRLRRDGETRGAHAGLLDATAQWSDSERAVVRGLIDASYSEFTAIVGNGRKLDAAAVDKLARGRVFLGSEAKTLGLCDETGSFADAVARAQALAGGRVSADPLLIGSAPRFGLRSLFGRAERASAIGRVFTDALADFFGVEHETWRRADNPLVSLLAYEALELQA